MAGNNHKELGKIGSIIQICKHSLRASSSLLPILFINFPMTMQQRKRRADDLFLLVHSLTPGEIEYFKKNYPGYAIGKSNNSMLLFGEMRVMKHYDEGELEERLKGKIDDFESAKVYLSKCLFRSLRAFRETGEHISFVLQNKVRNIDILMEKGLCRQMKNLLMHTEELARNYENFLTLLRLQMLLIAESDHARIKERLEQCPKNNTPAEPIYTAEDLFLFIHSLLPAEKRYFKVYTTRYESEKESMYDSLFDKLNSMDQYDERMVHDLLPEGQRVSDLMQLLFSSLRAYREDQPDYQTQNMIRDIEILIEKELYEQAKKKVRQAEKLARKENAYLALLHLAILRQTLIHQGNTTRVREDLQKVANSIDETQCRLNEEIQRHKPVNTMLWDTYNRLDKEIQIRMLYQEILAYARGHYRGTYHQKKAAFEETKAHPLLHTGTELFSFTAKRLLYGIQALCHEIDGNIEDAFHARKNTMWLWEQHQHRIAEAPRSFITTLSNFVGNCISRNQSQEIEEILDLLEQLLKKTLSPSIHTEIQQNLYHIRLLRCLNTAAENESQQNACSILNENAEFVETVTEWLRQYGSEQHKARINKARQFTLWYNVAIFHWMRALLCCSQVSVKECSVYLSKALSAFHAILNEPLSTIRMDIQIIVRLLHPVILYDLNIKEQIENKYRSAKNFIRKNNIRSEYYSTFLRFLSALSTYPPSLPEFCNTWKEEFTAFQNAPATARSIGLDEILLWIRCRKKK